jgi:hypothetical protein
MAMSRWVTTITIVHEAEAESIAQRDAETMRQQIRSALVESHEKGDVGAVRHVSLYQTKKV